MSEDKKEMTWFKWTVLVLQQGLTYSFVEVIFLVMFLAGRFTGDGEISGVILWTSFVVASLWTLITSTKGAAQDAKDAILDYHILTTDFAISALLLTAGAIALVGYPWWFLTMLLIAAAQNIRYVYLSSHWLLERTESNGKRKR